MKSIHLLTFFSALQLLMPEIQGQGLQLLLNVRQQSQIAAPSPTDMIDLMEKQLSAQFTTPAASHSTVSILSTGEVVARGTVLVGFDQSFCYLICPSDVIGSGSILVQANDGRIYEPLAKSTSRLLSRQDNLSILKIQFVPGAVSLSSLEVSREVGTFVGLLSKNKWKTGTVTNEIRSAFSKGDPRIQGSLRKHWKRIGLQVSKKRSGFPEVIESDLDLLPNEAGSPVFDRSGSWQGIAIARADRHSTLLVPAVRVASLIRDFEQGNRS